MQISYWVAGYEQTGPTKTGLDGFDLQKRAVANQTRIKYGNTTARQRDTVRLELEAYLGGDEVAGVQAILFVFCI
jgi:hypothetical protein